MLDWRAQMAGFRPAGDDAWLESYLRELQESRDADVRAALMAVVETLDDLDRLGNPGEGGAPGDAWGGALRVLRNQLRRRLAELGLQPMLTLGQPVDPRLHHVVETVDGDVPPATIVRELRAGYLYGGQLFRAALVVSVRSDAPPTDSEDQPASDQGGIGQGTNPTERDSNRPE